MFALLPRQISEGAALILHNFFTSFSFLGAKLGHFTINDFFSIYNKRKSLSAKYGKNPR
jgi:hypothetical protein